jgi:hypothetical protein
MGQYIFQLLLIFIPSLLMFGIVYYLVSNFLDNDENRRNIELKKIIASESSKVTLPLRLQAYERVLLCLERMHPNNLLHRESPQQITVAEYRERLVKNIRTEFEYNLSQQLYVSAESWRIAQNAKDQTIQLIHQLAMKIPAEASGIELSKLLFNYIFETDPEVFPTQIAINFLKEDVKNLF